MPITITLIIVIAILVYIYTTTEDRVQPQLHTAVTIMDHDNGTYTRVVTYNGDTHSRPLGSLSGHQLKKEIQMLELSYKVHVRVVVKPTKDTYPLYR